MSKIYSKGMPLNSTVLKQTGETLTVKRATSHNNILLFNFYVEVKKGFKQIKNVYLVLIHTKDTHIYTSK